MRVSIFPVTRVIGLILLLLLTIPLRAQTEQASALAAPSVDLCDSVTFPVTINESDPALAATFLVNAIECANSNPGHDTIILADGVTATFNVDYFDGGNATPGIQDALTIRAGDKPDDTPGNATIERDSDSPVKFNLFFIGIGIDVTLANLTLQGGDTPDNGGAIFNEGSLRVVNTTIQQNHSDSGGGGIHNGADADLTVVNSRFEANNADDGGAIFNAFLGRLNVTNTLIINNFFASGNGGGIYNTGVATVINSTLALNFEVGGDFGGGIYNALDGNLTLYNSIVFSNTARAQGDDIYNAGDLVVDGLLYDIIYDEPDASFSYTNVIDANPLFSGDFTLQASSPAVNAGTTVLYNANAPGETALGISVDGDGSSDDPVDIDLGGLPRIVGDIDFGAHEFNASDPCENISFPHTIDGTDASVNAEQLAQAINCANQTPGFDEIILRDGITATFAADWNSSGTATPSITDDLRVIALTAQGATGMATVERDTSSSEAFRLFHIAQDAAVTLTNLTIQGGRTFIRGAGITNEGALAIVNSIIRNNVADAANGGGVWSRGDLKIDNSTIRDNQARFAGGVHGDDGTVLIGDTVIIDNVAVGDGLGSGGGLGFTLGTATIANSIITGNSAELSGGGISTQIDLTLVNTLIADNQAYTGGGIGNGFVGDLTVVNSTIADNRAAGNGSNDGGGLYNIDPASATLYNTILFGNTADDNGNDIYNDASLSADYVLYAGYTQGPNGSATITNRVTGNPQFVDPGNTLYTLQAGSDALNAGNDTLYNTHATGETALGIDIDNDGDDNPIDVDLAQNNRFISTIDLGAYENQDICVAYAFPYTVRGNSEAAYATDLAQAIDCANKNGTGSPDVINLNGVTAAFSDDWQDSAIATPPISEDLTIQGNGGTVQRDANSNEDFGFFVLNANVTLTIADVTIRGAHEESAIRSAGNLTLTNVTIRDNQALAGAAVFTTSGTLDILNSTLDNNTATQDGGALLITQTTVTIQNSQITNNILTIPAGMSGIGGGIAFAIANVSISNTTLEGNMAVNGNGGSIGIGNSGSILTLTDAILRNNSATNGGAIANSGDNTVKIEHSTVNGNMAGQNGGGIWNSDTQGTVTLSGSRLNENTAIDGSAIHSEGPTTLIGSTVENGIASGIGAIVANNTVQLVNSIVRGNSAGTDGGGLYTRGNATLTNVVLSGNRADEPGSTGEGGGWYVDGGTSTATHITIGGNYATHQGGGIFVNNGQLTLYNSILSGNLSSSGGNDGLVGTSGTLTTESALYGDILNTGGTFNTINVIASGFSSGGYVVPVVNPPTQTPTNTGVFALLPASTGIDVGDPNLLPADTFDLNGNNNLIEPLPIDLAGGVRNSNGPDMGAYEARLYGDRDEDDVLEPTDFIYIINRIGSNDLSADIDGDSDVDATDVQMSLRLVE